MSKATLIRKIKDCTIYSTDEGTNGWLINDKQAKDILKLISEEIKNKKFTIGERKWCKDCGNNICKFLTTDTLK